MFEFSAICMRLTSHFHPILINSSSSIQFCTHVVKRWRSIPYCSFQHKILCLDSLLWQLVPAEKTNHCECKRYSMGSRKKERFEGFHRQHSSWMVVKEGRRRSRTSIRQFQYFEEEVVTKKEVSNEDTSCIVIPTCPTVSFFLFLMLVRYNEADLLKVWSMHWSQYANKSILVAYAQINWLPRIIIITFLNTFPWCKFHPGKPSREFFPVCKFHLGTVQEPSRNHPGTVPGLFLDGFPGHELVQEMLKRTDPFPVIPTVIHCTIK